MPVYEYRCSGCGWKFAKLVGMVAGASAEGLVCPKCGGTDVQRMISKFSRVRSDDERLDSLENAALAGGDDPDSMSKLMREMGREMAEEGDDGMEEYIEESEREIYDGSAGGDEVDFRLMGRFGIEMPKHRGAVLSPFRH